LTGIRDEAPGDAAVASDVREFMRLALKAIGKLSSFAMRWKVTSRIQAAGAR
jgi:hypothetical protein